MHLAIDASRSTVDQMTGTEHYSRQLITHLIAANDARYRPHQISLFFRDKPTAGLFPQSINVRVHVIPFPRMWTHLRFAFSLWRHRPDVTFVPAHTLPYRFPGKSVVTVHDLGYRVFPEAHPPRQLRYLDWSTKHSAERASLILADSQATAQDLTRFYNISQRKVRVIYPGVEPPIDRRDWTLYSKYQIPFHYFLYIGTLQPRKNIERIVQAYDIWQKANPDKQIALVLAGKQGWLFDENWIEGVDNVHLPGYVDEEDKGALMRQAMALVFPSLYEGFGFPVLEAMHVGTPVIASNTSSLPELVKDAGVLCDPESVIDIAASLDVVAEHDLLRRKLSIKGMLQAKTFKWERAAQQTLEALESVAKSEVSL